MLLLPVTLALYLLTATAAAGPFVFDDQKGCGDPKSPEQLAKGYCRLFELTPLLKRDQTARKSAEQCIRFYRNAAETANVVCSYRLKASLQAARYERATGAAEGGQRELVENLAVLNREAKEFHKDLLDKLQEKFDRTEVTNKAYGDSLANLAGIAGRTSVNESVCLVPPSEVPGTLLTGLLLHALEDKKKTFELLMEMINGLGDHADKASKAENAASFQLSQAGGNLGKVVPSPPSSISPAERGDPGREVEKPDGLFTQLVQRNTTAAFNRNVTSPLVRMANPAAHPLAPGLMGMNVNLVFRLLHKGHLDSIDYVSSGASLLAGVKATAARAHLLVTAVQTVEFAVRRYQYDSYVGKLHASFSVDHLKKNPQASSRQVSEAFRKHTQGKHCQGR